MRLQRHMSCFLLTFTPEQIAPVIARVFPVDIRHEFVAQGQDHAIVLQMQKHISDLFGEPLKKERERLERKIQKDLEPLLEKLVASKDQCMAAGEFVDWIHEHMCSSEGPIQKEDMTAILKNYCYFIHRRYWDEEVTDGNLSEES